MLELLSWGCQNPSLHRHQRRPSCPGARLSKVTRAIDPEMPTSGCLPPLPVLTTLTVCSGRLLAGLLHPAADHGIRDVSSCVPLSAPGSAHLAVVGLGLPSAFAAASPEGVAAAPAWGSADWSSVRRPFPSRPYPSKLSPREQVGSVTAPCRQVGPLRSPLPFPSRRSVDSPRRGLRSSEEARLPWFGVSSADLRALHHSRVRCVSTAFPPR